MSLLNRVVRMSVKKQRMDVSHQRYRQQGAGLMEVLVSLLILAIGLLGVVSMQTRGLGSNQQAMFVTEAQFLAQDMADRMLAFGTTSTYDNSGVWDSYNGIDVSGEFTGTDPKCASACDASATVAFDTDQWHQALYDSSLPRARGTVTKSDDIFSIQVMWDQDRTGEGAVECNSDNCFTMELTLL